MSATSFEMTEHNHLKIDSNVQLILKQEIDDNEDENQTSSVDQILNEEMNIEIRTINEIQPLTGDGNSDNEGERVEHNQSPKMFICNICNKDYNIYFHLKQHIKKVHDHGFHEEKKIFNLQPNTKIDECGNQTNANVTKLHKCHTCDKTFSTKGDKTRHIKMIH